MISASIGQILPYMSIFCPFTKWISQYPWDGCCDIVDNLEMRIVKACGYRDTLRWISLYHYVWSLSLGPVRGIAIPMVGYRDTLSFGDVLAQFWPSMHPYNTQLYVSAPNGTIGQFGSQKKEKRNIYTYELKT